MYSKVKLNMPHLINEYTIDTLGVVHNVTCNKTLAGTSISKQNRYVKIHLDKFYALHRLVAEHFVPNPNNLPQVNHIDGNRYNNQASNLEWVSAKTNVQHAHRVGLSSCNGERNNFSKLTEANVVAIWALRNSKLTAQQIRDKLMLDVSVDAVKAVRRGKNWTSVTSKLS